MTFQRCVLFILAAAALLCAPSAEADECSTIPGNLISNCGFESGTFASWNLSGFQSSSAYLGVSHGVDDVDAHTGAFGAYLGGFGGVLSLAQSVSTAVGTTYQISYWLAQSPATVAPYQSSFLTSFGANTLFSGGNAPNLPYTYYSFSTVATATFSVLQFGARDDTGFFALDDVSVLPVSTPEPSSAWLSVTALAVLSGALCLSARRC